MIEFSQVHCLTPQWHILVNRYYRGCIVRVGDGFGVMVDGRHIADCETFDQAQQAAINVVDIQRRKFLTR